jgi:lipid-binding SYLF domain-containing protein
MNRMLRGLSVAATLVLSIGVAHAGSYKDTVSLFKNAGQSAAFFGNSYAYAVFPTIGKGGFIVGAAHGRGRVYTHQGVIGDASVTQVSVGAQAGGEAYSEIVFFEDKRALDEFEAGHLEFGADVNVVAITASASAGVSTNSAQAGASGGEKDAVTAGHYQKGVAVFTIAKGGLMYDANLAGQKFSYTPRG